MLLPASQYVAASAFTWPAALFLWGPGSWTDLHRHHCVQLVMGVDKTLLCERRPPSIDHRVKRVLRDLPSRLAETGAVSLDAVAASVGLSPSRFLHLFTRSVGVPLRPYVLWLRLQCGARELGRGKSVAEAAYAAGFSDAAHFTRTFRRMMARRHARFCSAGWPPVTFT